jgi:hypothetical protein
MASICEPAAVTLLAAKILLSPLCVIAVSLAGRRWGVAVAGVLGGLPVVAGPILLVETLLHGRDFGVDAAAGALFGLAALTAFVVVYGRVTPAVASRKSGSCCATSSLVSTGSPPSASRSRSPCQPWRPPPPSPLQRRRRLPYRRHSFSFAHASRPRPSRAGAEDRRS